VSKRPTDRGPRAASGTGSVRPYRGKWRVKVTVGLLNGKQQQVSRVIPTRKEAELVRAQLIADASRGLLRLPSDVLIDTQLQHWLKDKVGTVGPVTHENYRYLTEKYIIPALGHLRLQTLKPSQVRQFYTTLADRYSTSLLRQVRTVLIQAFDEAVLDEVLPRNPAKGLRLPKGQEAGEKSRALSPEEVRSLLTAARDHPLGMVAEVLILTGLRRSEVCGLKWDCLDLEAGLLHVRERVAMSNGRPLLGALKSEASRRTVPLSGSTVTLLQAWRSEQARRHTALSQLTLETGFVFTNLSGQCLHPDALSRLIPNLGREAGLGRVRCHDLRHTFTSLQLARGVPAEVVQGWLGHASVNVTLDVYRHILPHEHTRHVAGLDQLLDQGPANVPISQGAGTNRPERPFNVRMPGSVSSFENMRSRRHSGTFSPNSGTFRPTL